MAFKVKCKPMDRLSSFREKKKKKAEIADKFLFPSFFCMSPNEVKRRRYGAPLLVKVIKLS